MNFSPGTRLGSYELLSRLGAGGMGVVYLAQDTKLHRKVALKLLSGELADRPDKRRRFIQEAEAAAALSHPNVAHIYEVNQADKVNFIAMEYVEGDTLRQKIANGRIDLRDVLEIVIQVASALASAHRSGIIHRDIKPENIMLRPDGYVKVLDFGLAKLTYNPAHSVDTAAPTLARVVTEPGLLLGTVNYMSPEQARGKDVDARTDVFSFGVLVYEMVTGRAPFAGETTSDVIASILTSDPPALSTYLPELPAELQRIVSKSLQKHKEARYASFDDLLIDLRNLKQQLEDNTKSNRNVGAQPANRVGTEGGHAAATASEHATTEQPAARPSTGAEYVVSQIRQHKRLAAISVVLFLVGCIGAYLMLGPSSPSDTGSIQTRAISSLAVLPFTNASADPDNEFLSDGISESLINSLSQLSQLKVMARTTAFRFKGRDSDPQAVGRELKVDAVLTGKLIQHGDSLSVQVDLVNTRDGSQLWGEKYSRKVSDMLEVQDEIARQISERLRLKLTGKEQQSLVKRYTDSSEAYQLYVKGRFYWNKRTGDGIRKSVEYFQQAIDKDQRYALAYAGLADAYSVIPSFSDGSPDEFFPKAKESARRALDLDETLAEAHTALARVLFAYDWKFAESDKEYQRAIELNPNYATAHHWYGNANLSRTERFEEAIAEMKRAQDIDPLSLIINADLGETYFLARRYDEAIEQLQKTIEMDQGFRNAQWKLGMAYHMKGLYPEAIAAYDRVGLLEDDRWMVALYAQTYAASGKRREALRMLAQLKEMTRKQYVPPYNLAVVCAALGEKDQAFGWLEMSYRERDQKLTRLKVDPFLDPLRSDPRFQDLVRRVGLP